MKKRLFGILGFFATIILGLALASMYVKPNNKDVLSLFGLVFPYIYLFALIVLPFLYRQHKITFFLGLFLLIFGLKPILSYVKPGSVNTLKSEDLQVMTFNAMMGFKMVDSHHQFKEKNQDNLDKLLLQYPPPAIVCVQEASSMVRKAFSTTFKGYNHHEIDRRGAIILSKYKIFNKGEIDFGSKLNSCLWADIQVTVKDTIRVYSLHLESNRLSKSSYAFLAKDDYEPQEAIEGIKDLIIKYPQYAEKRGKQALMVKAHINKSPYPVIVCGDLNDPPMSYTYHTIKKGSQ